MTKNGVIHALGVTIVLGMVLARAEEPGATAMRQPFVHLYADANGVSHFRDETLTIQPGAAGPAALELSKSPGATLLALKRGQKEDWHRAPRRMYLIALKGMSEVTVGDGEVRRFAPGTLLLMDDTTGKGHITRAVGSEDHIALTVPAPAPAP
jgi:quercetin dioxygenase-like cupin family protein